MSPVRLKLPLAATLIVVLNIVGHCRGYLVIVTDEQPVGHPIFDAGLPRLGPTRHYAINTHRSAGFVGRLLSVDEKSGLVTLKAALDCEGVYYPSLFTVYVDSLSNLSRGVDYYSLPLRIFVAGQRCRNDDASDDNRIHIKVSEAKRWISETYLSYAIPGTESWKQICLRRSQFMTSLAGVLPQSIREKCAVKYVDVSDPRFRVETNAGDLVSADNQCITEPLWKVTVLLEISCEREKPVSRGYVAEGLVSATEHRLKIVYHHQDLNDTDIAHRVRRELRNQSPYFEQALYVASVMEEKPPGAPVATVRARDPENSPVTYSMVSLLDSRSQGMFAIDTKSGIVTTNARLDRELVDVHYFHITATDDSFPPRSGTTTLQVNVLDANDHAPAFEATQYEATVRESVTVGSTVVTLRATDQDIGRNAEVEYSLVRQDSGGAADVPDGFRIDPKSGVVSVRVALDRERADTYTLVAQAADQARPAQERRTATATVVVRVLDDNDNYPQFTERTYAVGVGEDVDWTQSPVIATVKATDEDQGSNAAIRYAIISGNTQSQFSIDSTSGEVSLVKALDYETLRRYRLVIRAQDGGSPSRSNTTQLLVNVQDVNDNAPRFYTSLFQESVSESVPSGFSIVRVQAYDADEGENANIRYSIGARDGSGGSTLDLPLAVDERSGWVHTTRELDREHHARYQLQVIATDSGVPPRSVTASVVITVQDVNDNDPVFEPKLYEAVVSEGDSPGTPVASVTASDRDENPRLHYELTGGNVRGRFAITSQNGQGLITVAQPLDYKQEKRFVLTVTASDSGRRQDTATVYVNVTDANNYAPVFENAPYAVSVFEDAPIGTTIVVVEATDGDVEQNAQITYSLGVSDETTSPEFEINPQTGAITTRRLLDREATLGYQLTVTARDGGTPQLSDTTSVDVTVADVNDSPPAFKKASYAGAVAEDALVGTSVVQISASDADSGLNGRIRYALSADATADGSFVVDPTSGVIRTAKSLDRESVAQFQIVAYAIDRGSPALSGSVDVTINVEDINDSPPAFASDKIVMYIAENSPVGSTVGEIHARDPDEGPNAVVQYSIIGGEDSNSFSLVTRPGSDKAELLTMVELDYESPRKRYELLVRAASPPLRADAHVEVLITDVNDNAPSLRDFQVTFNNFRSCFPTGPFGRIPATDADVSDQLRYRILSGNNANLVTLNASTGALTLSPQLNTNVPKLATMEVSVTDGVNEVKAVMQLAVRMVTDEMLFNSITVRLNDMTEEAFLSPLLTFFVEGLAAILPCPRENIFVFSIQDDTDVNSKILNVSFSARRPDLDGPEFYPPQFLQERVYLNRAILARLATVQVLPFDDNLCVREPCLNYEQCLTVLKFGNASGFIHSDTVLFRPIYPVTTFACRCPQGFTGNREHYLCDTEVNLCYSNPCGRQGECRRKEGGYTCICQPGFTGRNCEIDLELDTCQPGICRSSSSCAPLVRGGFVCENCSPSGGQEHYTQLCELRSRSFSQSAFLTFPALRQRHRLHLKLRFATQSQYGMLLYNGRYNEKHDFVSLEVVAGAVHFSFSLGSAVTTTVAVVPGGVSDGRWHDVAVDYFNKSATVSIDGCDTSLALKHGAALGAEWACANSSARVLESRCSVLTETCHRYLDLTGPMQVGGLPTLPTSFQVHTKDFVGCISDLYIDHAFVDLNGYVADNGTVAGCPEQKAFCVSSPCKNDGECTDGWGTYLCACPEGFSGKDCSEPVPRPWRFQGDGVLSFNPLLRPIQLPWLNALSVRTLQKDAFLMSIQIGQNSSATLSLVGGEVQYSYNEETVRLANADVADGRWHRVEAKWMNSEVWLSVDYGQREVTAQPANKLQGLYVGKILIGGPDATAGSLNTEYDYFDGCIQDVRVGSSTAGLARPTVRENVGEGCAGIDKCAGGAHGCPAHSDCIAGWEQSRCKCHKGYVGPECVPACDVGPCENAARCAAAPRAALGYACRCNSTAHSGAYCERRVDQPCPSSWWGAPVCGPCRCDTERGYHADCDKTDGTCSCKENHYQPADSTKCLPCDCYATGSFSTHCDRLTGQCKCRSGVIGARCDSCPNPYAEVTLRGCEVVYDGCPRSYAGDLWWQRTKFGYTALEDCPSRSQGRAARACDERLGGWQEPDLFNCTSDAFLDLRKVLGQMETSTLQVNTFVAVKVAADLSRAANATQELRGADVLIAQQLLRELLGYESRESGLNLTHSQDKDYIENIVQTASAILDEKYVDHWAGVDRLTESTAEHLVLAIEKYLSTLATSQRDTYTSPFEIVSENMVLGLDVVTADSLYGYEPVPGQKGGGGDGGERVVLPDTSQFLQQPPQASTLGHPPAPPTLSFPKYNNYLMDRTKFDPWSRVGVPLPLLGIRPVGAGEVHTARTPLPAEQRAAFAYAQYRGAAGAGSAMPERYDATVARRWGVGVRVGAPMVSVAMQVPKVAGAGKPTEYHLLTGVLPQPILLRLRLDDVRQSGRVNPQCVHWSTAGVGADAGARGEWSRAGCTTQAPEEGGSWSGAAASGREPYMVNCTCNRLATFTVLVDVVDEQYIPEPTLWEDVATWVAFCVSLPVLLAALLVLALIRGAQTNSNSIHKNVVLCVFLAELLFFVALKARRTLTQEEFPCKLTAMGLHYLWLTAFTWTLVDALHLYRMLTEMRDINHGPMRFYYTVGYGLPAVVVGLAVGVRADQYGNFYFCWLSIYESVVWSLIGPVCVCVLVNMSVLAFCVRAAFTLKDHVMGFGNLRTLLWLSVVSLPLLGVSWVLSVLAVSEREPALTYMLACAVLAHSAFALVGYCFLNARVRRNLRYSVLRCLGRKAPLDGSDRASSQGNLTATPASRSALAYHGAGGGGPDLAARRHVGISTSSTTSRSTGKTGSSPYRSDTHLRHTTTSTSTSNYNSDQPSSFYAAPRGAYEPSLMHAQRHREAVGEENSARVRHESDSDSEVSADGRSLELASSHSSDDDESSNRRRPSRQQHIGVTAGGGAPAYLPNICEDPAQLSGGSRVSSPRPPGRPAVPPPPSLNIVNKAQLFPNLKPMYAPRWSSQLPDAYLPTMTEGSNGRGSQWSGTASDNETTSPQDHHHHKLLASHGLMAPHELMASHELMAPHEQMASHQNYPHHKVVAGHENFHRRAEPAEQPDSEDKMADKYLFPYTAEEDHCGGGKRSPGGFILPLSGRILASSEFAGLRASPSPLLYPGSMMVPTSGNISESDEEGYE